MQHLDEGMIHAWLDGELPSAEREALEAHIASCEQCAASLAEARGFVAASSRILTALDTVPGGVLPATPPASRAEPTPARFTVSRAWMAVAAVLVLSTVSVIATRSGSNAPLAKLDEARATRSDAPVAAPATEEPAGVVAASPAEKSADNSIAVQPTSPEQSQAASGGALKDAERSRARVVPERAEKSPVPTAPEKKEARESALGAPSTAIAEAAPVAAPAAAATKPGLPEQASSPVTTANMDAKAQRDTNQISALAAQSPNAPVADSGRKRPALMLNEIVVTRAGTTSATDKLGAGNATNEAPQLVSTSTSTEAGDTVVTAVYAVRNGTVTLVERPSVRDELRRQKGSVGFSDQVMAKAREDTRVNSITWSDSSGHTRTLRGAVSRGDLERIRTALFGSTP